MTMSRARARRPQRKPVRAPRRLKKVRVPRKVRLAPTARVAKKVRVPSPTPAELGLLALAQKIAELARDGGGSQALSAALQTLAAAYGPTAPLPRDVFRAWVPSRTDKNATLALAWAREQVRLGLQEVVERTMKGARGRVDVDAGTFAWLLLAACEAIAQEPPSAVGGPVAGLPHVLVPASAPPRERSRPGNRRRRPAAPGWPGRERGWPRRRRRPRPC